jgi:serine/threonine-protein kinase
LQDYNDAIIINPSEPMAYMFRAMEKRNTLSDLTGAIMDFDKSIEYKSNNSEAYGSRGIAKIELNKIQE